MQKDAKMQGRGGLDAKDRGAGIPCIPCIAAPRRTASPASVQRPPSRPNSSHPRCRTGCVGVCLRAKTERLKSGPKTRLFYQVLVGAAFGRRRWLLFPISTLGRAEAFRRAVRARAQYELAVREARGEV